MGNSKQILISGYYGFGNTGDEAVLAAIVQALRARGISEITVFSANPEETARAHGVRAVSRTSPKTLWAEMRHASLLISGGGSLFQDATSTRSVIFYYGVLAIARLARLPVMIYAQGVGPLNSSLSRRLTRSAFNHARAITVRDQGSEALLGKLGVRTPIEITADPVFALEPAPATHASEILAAEGIANAPFMVVAIRPWPGIDAQIPALASALDAHCKKSGLHCVFLPMQPEQDRDVSKAVADAMRAPTTLLRGGYHPTETMAIIHQASLVVAMRLHALIFAAAGGVPLAGISYDPKVDDLLSQFGARPICNVSGITQEALQASLNSLWDNRATEIELLNERAIALRERALRSAAVAVNLLASPKR